MQLKYDISVYKNLRIQNKCVLRMKHI